MLKKLLVPLSIVVLSCSIFTQGLPSGAPTSTTIPPSPTPIPTQTPTPIPPTPTPAPLPPSSMRVKFLAEDGAALVGNYYPAADPDAPVFLLMHSVKDDQSIWSKLGLAQWLQNRDFEPPAASQFPPMPEDLSFGVFTFDFRGYGESSGARGRWNPNGWTLDANAAMQTVGALPVDDSMFKNFRSVPAPLPGIEALSLMPVFLPKGEPVESLAVPIPDTNDLFILPASSTDPGAAGGIPQPFPLPDSGGVTVLPFNQTDPVSATPIEIPGEGDVSIVPVYIPGVGPASGIPQPQPVPMPGNEGVSILPIDPTDPVGATPIEIPGKGDVSVVPIYVSGIDPVSATPIEIPGTGGVTALPLDSTDPVSATPIEIPGKGIVNVIPVFLPGSDSVSATPIEIPGTGGVSVIPLPLPVPGPAAGDPVSVTISGPEGDTVAEFSYPGPGQVSGLPVPIPGGDGISVAPVFVPGIDTVGATPIEIPGTGGVSVLPIPLPDPDLVGTVPVPIPGGGDVSVAPVFIPGIDPVDATPIEIPGTGGVSVVPLPVPVPGPDLVGTVPVPIPGDGDASIFPVFIPGIDPVSATPIEIPGKGRIFVLAMAPLAPDDPRILRPPTHTPQVVTMGSSIGADAAVNVCNGNCIGALSLSPGNWLGADYSESVDASKDMLVWCVAAEGDGQAARTCDNASGENYKDTYYPGNKHGSALFEEEASQVSPLGQLVFDFVMQLQAYQE